MQLTLVRPGEYARVDDLLDAYFQAVREYNVALGAYDMSPAEIRDAREREALSYAKVKRLKDRLRAAGIEM